MEVFIFVYWEYKFLGHKLAGFYAYILNATVQF